MNALPTAGTWLGTVGLLAAQCVVLLGAAGLLQGLTRTPQRRRHVWLAAMAGLVLLLGNSLFGLDQSLSRLIATGPSLSPAFTVRANLPAGSNQAGMAGIDPGLWSAASDKTGKPTDPAANPGGVAWPAWVWLAGAVAAGVWALVPRLWLALACRRGTSAESPEFQRRLQGLATQLGIRGRVRVVRLPRLTAPVAFGVLRPSVGLPVESWAAHSAAEQDAMLAHELAHLSVRDPLWLCLADVLVALLWWHPLVWWARRQFRAASETAADEASLLVEDGPAVLAGCLVALASRWHQRGVLGLLSMAGFRSDLGRRVERLLRLRRHGHRLARRQWPELIASMGTGVLLVVLVVVSARLLPVQAVARSPLLAVVGGALIRGAAEDGVLAVAEGGVSGLGAPEGSTIAPAAGMTNFMASAAVRVPPIAGRDVRSALAISMEAVAHRLHALDLFGEVRCEPLDVDRFRVVLAVKPARSREGFPAAAVREVLTQSGEIQFRRVHPDTAKLIEGGVCPGDCEVLPQRRVGAMPGSRLVVFRRVEANLTSANLREVRVKRDPVYDELRVALSLDEVGTRAFADLTRASIGQQIAVVLEGTVLMAPRVREEIPVGACELSGNWSEDEARALAAALAHPLPWKLVVEEEALGPGTADPRPEVESTAGSAAPATELIKLVSIAIAGDGRLMFDQHEETLESIQGKLRKMITGPGTVVVRLSAADTAPAHRVHAVIEACGAAGVGVTVSSLGTLEPGPMATGAAVMPGVASLPGSLPALPGIESAVAETHALATRTFRVEPRTLAAGLDAVAGKGQTHLTVREQLGRYFAAAGLEFAAADGLPTDQAMVRAFFYNERNGMLLVRATPAELGAVEQALQVLNLAQPQVVIEARFVEVSMDSQESLGFDWYLGGTLVGSNTIPGRSAGMAGAVFPAAPGEASNPVADEGIATGLRGNPGLHGTSFVAGPAGGANVVRELRGDQLAWPGRGATNAGNIRVSAAQGVTVTGILTDPQFRTVVRALEQRRGVEVLSAPRVTTLSGRQAQIQVSDVRTVLTGVNPEAMKGRGAGAATNPLPFTSASIPTGPSLDVVPVVSADGATINLTVIPTVTEFLGYDEPPRNSKVEILENGKPRRVDPPLPRFRVRQMVTQAVVRDGQTLVLGGFPVEETRLILDRVPVLGSIPIAGRLFRRESRSVVRKQLMVLVTATVVDPAGNPVHATRP